ncbi:nucleotidyl transferase AbiEii/AbiGii toxin family protein [Suilimivivens sp.]|uniref:nucleotidyl transferase AbiEii/AbiGii toxin family protein n=1 Tax=Suilimivivens sp. TaxID=2981669 RepID=UPI003077FBFA
MKEIMQEIVLCGLSRAGFFQKAAFYGGTALRIFYGLDRFSEGLQLTRSIFGNDCFSLDSLHQMKNVPCQSLSKCFMTDLTLLILSRQNRM